MYDCVHIIWEMFQMSILIFGVLDCVIFDLIIVQPLFQSRIVHVGKE